jgi:hypothetical protein
MVIAATSRLESSGLGRNSEKVQNGVVADDLQEVQWSELARDPKGVAAKADVGDVRVKRRDGADLLLTREDRVASTELGSLTAVRALRNLVAHLPADVTRAALAEEFPWLSLLPEEALPDFVADFVRAAQASAELGRWSVLAQTIHEWKATAAIYADPALLAALSTPITGDFGPVPSPVAEA